jgi:lipoprotein-anchoring transpeptidase ErfK/SrfK
MANIPVSQIDPVTRRRVPAPRPKPPRSAASVMLRWGIGFLVLALIVMGALTALYFSDLTLPGVQAMGVNLGGQTTSQAVETLQTQWNQRTIVVSTADKSWSAPPTELGLILDAEAMVQQAHAQGRSSVSLMRLWQGEATVDPIWHFDRVRADSMLQVLAAQVTLPGQDANVQITGGRIEQTPPVMGRALDIGATAHWLEAHAAQVLEERKLNLITMPVAPPVADVSPAVAQARSLLSAPRTIELYDALKNEHFTWTIPPEVLGGWLTLHLNPEDQHWLNWTVDQAKVQAYLAKQSATLGNLRYVNMDKALPAVMALTQKPGPAIKLPVLHSEQQHVVKAGETVSSIASDYGIPYPWIQAANPGLGDFLRVGQSITIPSPDVLLPLPPVENKRIIVSISGQTVQAFEDGKVKWQWQGSTGMASSPTAPGTYQIRTHEPNAYAANWNLWMPWFMGIYQPVPGNDFMNGFHGFPKRGGTQLLWTANLGTPVTYGCILVSTDNAKALYDWAQEGVVVEIRK